MYRIHETEVLVVGSGGAGCRAALEAFHEGAQVTLITKGRFGKSGTTAFRVADTAGYNLADGAVDPEDNPGVHFEDIVRAGKGMAYEELAHILATEGLETGTYLESLGVHFERDSSANHPIEVIGCFASRPRMHILKDHGKQIINALVPEIEKSAIDVIERTTICELLVSDGVCAGALGISPKGDLEVFKAKTVVLGCGGAGQLFKYTLTPPDITGDGYGLGLRAGAQLVNMEFMQVVLGTLRPTRNQFNTFLWCARPPLLNAAGESVLKTYLPDGLTEEECMHDKSTHFPFSTCDRSRFIEIAVQQEALGSESNTEKGVYIDLTGVTDDAVAALPAESPLPKVWPIVREFMAKRGFAIEREPVPVACFAHAINGGLKIDVNGQTTLPGLYAAGEVAGGPHGADRLGGNMLLSCQVFGARAGRSAARCAAETDYTVFPEEQAKEAVERLDTLKEQHGTVKVQYLKRRLQEAMWKGVLVVRSERKLKRTLNALAEIRADLSEVHVASTNDLKSFLELENLIDVGVAISRAALHRKESRGSHYREDFPTIDSKWEKRILIGYSNGQIFEQVEPTRKATST